MIDLGYEISRDPATGRSVPSTDAAFTYRAEDVMLIWDRDVVQQIGIIAKIPLAKPVVETPLSTAETDFDRWFMTEFYLSLEWPAGKEDPETSSTRSLPDLKKS